VRTRRVQERLRAHLRELVDPKIAEHRGRTVKNTGDGLLSEFPSVVDAVRCAVEVQRGMDDREPDLPEERRIRFRIGVNLGDVIAEEHDIFGDGLILQRGWRHWPSRAGSASAE
jgi:adenylate cyclase